MLILKATKTAGILDRTMGFDIVVNVDLAFRGVHYNKK
jgi:hypothetical protein